MYKPTSTYRIQFNSGFGFKDLEARIPYLATLGIGAIYASPIFKAVAGSTHGYDTLNPHEINPEIGTLADLRRLKKKLKKESIGWIQDIVPNHMAFDPQNPWLFDVLQAGPESPYVKYFDTLCDFESQPLMAPFLGSTLEAVISSGDVSLTAGKDQFYIKVYETLWPLNERSVDFLKQRGVSINDAETLNILNQDKDALIEIVSRQYYRLCHWQETDKEINYRRFFTINGLICLNIQDRAAFDDFHSVIAELVAEGIFDGLRIDHIDGLYDPLNYLLSLRKLVGEDTYIVVEKILAAGEKLPANWPVQGSTGYDFLALVNKLLIPPRTETAFSDLYKEITSQEIDSKHDELKSKRFILENHMQGELNNLADLYRRSLPEVGIPEKPLIDIIASFLVNFPVYRLYPSTEALADEELQILHSVFGAMGSQESAGEKHLRTFKDALLTGTGDQPEAAALHFFRRCMQFSGPLMAKGIEDTLMYSNSRFVARNEVGDSVYTFGMAPEEFHAQMAARTPLAMNATATHDTKRGEDSRTRLNALASMIPEWRLFIRQWIGDQEASPDPIDRYFSAQALIGGYPFPGSSNDHFEQRIIEYQIKALREAKRHSNWAAPDHAYEDAASNFLKISLREDGEQFQAAQKLLNKLYDAGIRNSLVQLILKYTLPGIPDVYQGCENWDLSFVDPDNRRPVDFDINERLLKRDITDYPVLWEERYSGIIKIKLTQALNLARKRFPSIFTEGDYRPLQVAGKYSDHILAFARRHDQEWLITVVPLYLSSSGLPGWKDARVILPDGFPTQGSSILDNQDIKFKREIKVNELFGDWPFAVYYARQRDNKRGAGILLHVSSLPSLFGTGDLGPEAYNFAQFLSRAGQKYWQILPLTPVDEGSAYSPYSSFSAMAGNTLLISPELLVQDNLLTTAELHDYVLPQDAKADFGAAAVSRAALLTKAYQRFKSEPSLHTAFEAFVEQEAYWLDDFAFYAVLREQYKGKPWYLWPARYRNGPSGSPSPGKPQAARIREIKWQQFIFFRQWSGLREHCEALNISIIGDIPFYVSHDSADVWANQNLFKIDSKGQAEGLAGVPPDYFNANGQMWGMPVFNWEAMAADGYQWWKHRLRKNMELCHVLRLDHFRAFDEYWEVPAGSTDARNGVWVPGPGDNFFKNLKQEFGDLPFIAEDLGEISGSVYQLRDRHKLPGMKVLQFAFGKDIAGTIHIPHNYSSNSIVYTGTHDNNTTRGWYRGEADRTVKDNLTRYTGIKITEKNVHTDMIRLAYASVADVAIIPAQDICGMVETARMNMPASVDSNWIWRLRPGDLEPRDADRLFDLADLFNRY